MLPLLNEYVRAARQELMDIQNVALDEIRTLRRGTTWDPDPELIGDGLRNIVMPLAAAAVEAGGRGAADLGAATSTEPVSVQLSSGCIEGMSDALVASVVAAFLLGILIGRLSAR